MAKKLQLIGIYTEDILYSILFRKFINGIINNEEIPEITDEYLKQHLAKIFSMDINDIIFKRSIIKRKQVIEIYLNLN